MLKTQIIQSAQLPLTINQKQQTVAWIRRNYHKDLSSPDKRKLRISEKKEQDPIPIIFTKT